MLHEMILILVWLQTSWCQDCTRADPKCYTCFYASIGVIQCNRCHAGYRLENNKKCSPCNVQSCHQCDTDADICQQCRAQYGLQSHYMTLDTCQKCKISHCHICNYNQFVCNHCLVGYGKSTSEPDKCKPCLLQNCTYCAPNIQSCQYCNPPLGFDHAAKECKSCYQSACLYCSWNYFQCHKCIEGKGPNDQRFCKDCNQTACLICSANYTVCQKCVRRTALHAPYCLPCVDQNCSDCPNQNITCTECDTGKNIGVSDAGRCQTCDLNCSQCSTKNYTVCLSCVDGYFVNNTICSPCSNSMPQCLKCKDHDYCTKCIQILWVLNMVTHQCDDVCGDQITLKNACDKKLGVLYDGCTDECKIEQNFGCQVNDKKTECWYQQKLEIDLTELIKQKFENRILVKFTIWPILDAFKYKNVSKLFKMQPQIYNILETRFDIKNGNVQIDASFNKTILNEQIKIVFRPDNMNRKFLRTPQSEIMFEVLEMNYYSQMSLNFGKVLSYLCTIAVILGWIGIVIGIVAKALAGIQTFVGLQIVLFVFVWMKIPLFEPLQGGENLQYLIFYVKQPFFFSEQTPVQSPLTSNFVFRDKLQQPPHLGEFNFEAGSFSNNFNIALIFQIVPLISLLILAVLVNISRNKLRKMRQQDGKTYKDEYNTQTDSDQYKLHVKLTRMEKAKQISATLLMCFGTLNIMGFVSALFLFFNYSAPPFDSKELIAICISGGVFIMTIILFFYDSDPFDYFRYSFKKQELALLQYVFFLIVFISTLVTILMFPQISWASMIPFSTLLLYTTIYQPYKEARENIRSVILDLIILFVLGFRVYIQYFPERMNNEWTYIYILVIGSLLVILGILTIIYLIYRIIYFCYILPKLSKSDHEQILIELETIKIKEKMKYSKNDSVFKKVLMNEMNILDFSNEMKNLAIESNLLSPNISDRSINTKENDDEGRKLRRQMRENGMIKNLSVETSQNGEQYLLVYQKHQQRMQQNNNNLFNEYKQNTDRKQNNNNNNSSNNNYDQLDVDKRQELKREFVLQMMVEQNKFLHLKSAEQDYVEMIAEKAIDNQLFLQQYQRIQ